jgi:hypothetical protein
MEVDPDGHENMDVDPEYVHISDILPGRFIQQDIYQWRQ